MPQKAIRFSVHFEDIFSQVSSNYLKTVQKLRDASYLDEQNGGVRWNFG